MKSEAELTLIVLECYVKEGPSLSIKDLCLKTKISEKRIRDILLVLVKRGYLAKGKDTDVYTLSRKVTMLI